MNLGFPTTSVKFGRDTFNASDWRYVTFVVDRDKMLGRCILMVTKWLKLRWGSEL